MVCIKIDVPKELKYIENKLKVIYRSKDIVCFFIFKHREQRNKFLEKTKVIKEVKQETIYKEYQS